MKRILFIAAVALLFTACNSEERQIEKAAYGYLDAMGNYRIDDAEPFASQETRERTLPFVKNTLIPMTDTAYIQANQPATIVIDSLRILCSDTAKVDYTKTTPLKTLTGTIHMVKEEGRWLAYVPLALPESINLPIPQENSDTTAQ
jgi:hypothetical protein